MLMSSESVDAASLDGQSTRQSTGGSLDSPVKSARYLLLNVDCRIEAIAKVRNQIARYVTTPSTAQGDIANPGRIALQRDAARLDPADTMPASVQAQGCEVVVRETRGGTARATTHMPRKPYPPTNNA
jgi:hypothetical protein